MTCSTQNWAADQDLPCCLKYLLETVCDGAGMTRDTCVDHVWYAQRCGLSVAEIGPALFELQATGHLHILRQSDTSTAIALNFPEQHWERSQPKVSMSPRNSNGPGNLYVLGCDQMMISKVGITTNLANRVSVLQSQASVAVHLAWSHACDMASARQFETKILKRFSANILRGEWLSVDAATLIAFSKTVIGGVE